MSKIEKYLIGVALGAVFPILGFLILWFGTFLILPEKMIPPAASAGLIIGLLIDLLFLRKWIRTAYSIRLTTWMVVYVFYSISIIGFFMGLPVFNLVLALPAGLFIGAVLARRQADSAEVKRLSRNVCIFTTAVLAMVCLFSAFVALAHPYTGSELEGMFALPFKITRTMLWGIIAVGGFGMLLLQWSVTAVVIRRTYSAMLTKTSLPLPID